MIEALFSSPGYQATKKMLDATALQRLAIQNNINHLETPHYRRLQLSPSFQTELQKALASGDQQRVSSLQPRLEIDSAAKSQRLDGNTVNLEHELLEHNKNSLEHMFQTQSITGAMLRLRTAITGRNA